MVYIETQKVGFKHAAIAQAQILEIPKINYSQLARAIYTGQNSISFVTQLGKTQKFNVLTSGRERTKNKAIEIATEKMITFQKLLVGVKFNDCEIDNIVLKKHSVLCHILEVPLARKWNPITELTTKLGSIDCPITIFLNIQSLPLSKETLEKIRDNDPGQNSIVSDPSFAVSYSILITDDDRKRLRNNLELLLPMLGGVYNTDGNNLQVKIDTKRNKIVKALKTLLFGKLYYKTLMSLSDLAPLLHIPKIYGIDTVEKPDFYVPTISNYQANNHIPIGHVLGNFDEKLYPAYLDPNSIFQNIVVWGAIGFGKSTFVKHLIVGLHNQTDTKMLIFDFHNEYREIARSLDGELGKDVLIFNPFIYPFSINPLGVPDDVTGKKKEIIVVETIENFISLLKNGLDWTMGEVQLNRCRIHLNELYEETTSPTISQLIELLKNDMRTRTKQDEDHLPFKLSQFTEGFYGELFNQPHTTLPFENIENVTSIFELSDLPIEMRTFFITVFLSQFWNHRRVNKNNPPVLIVVDEFHHLDRMIIPRKIISEGRKFSTGILISHQGPNQLTDRNLLGEEIRNTITKVAFKSVNRYDNALILSSLGINNEKWMTHLTRMNVGEAIVTIDGVPQPFRIKTEKFPQTELITDGQVKEMGEFLIKKTDVIENRPVLIQHELDGNISSDEERFLQLLHENPESRTRQITAEMRINAKKGSDIKNNLVEKGLIIEKDVRTGPGRPRKILELTDKGYQILGVERLGSPAHYGGNEHRMMTKEIAGLLIGLGYDTEIEESCDIKATKDDESLAFEVETCKNFNNDQITFNINRNLKWASDIVITCPNSKDKGRILQLINNRNIKKAYVLTYNELRKILMDSNNKTV